ncbi:MAG TPA: dTMP kinase [Candidatus Cybelea sp.]|nr:dTMP kinase [Candidatus Cybelea sp.]
MAERGIFIAIDGIDGSGKSTLVASLGERLKPLNVLTTREPTDASKWGRALRKAATAGRLPKATEIDYFHRDRMHHLATLIRPALAAGRPVVTDRYVDSTLAFQAEDPASASALYARFAPDILVPDVTFILDCPVGKGAGRIEGSRPGRSPFENRETQLRAQRIYASRQGGHYEHIDASGSAAETFRQVAVALARRFPKLAPLLHPAGHG